MNLKTLCFALVLAGTLSMCNCSSAPVVVTLNFPGGNALGIDLGQSITITVVAANDGGQGVTWTCTGPACTALANITSLAVTFNANGVTGTATITATSKKNRSISKSVVVTVNAVLAVPSTAAVQALLTADPGTQGSPFTFTFTATGGTAPLTWSWNLTAAESDGLSLSGSGEITGTPTSPETLTFTVMVSDSSAADATLPIGPLNLTVNSSAPVTENFVYYASGLETINETSPNFPNFYAVAGVVTINTSTGLVVPNGNGVGGEQDYNDGDGITSPQPSGDTITGGQLTVDSTTGQGTLELITNNMSLGVAGTETFAVQFVNPEHALIAQFDGSATSSGSMDMQTSTSTPSGNFAFTLSGVDPEYESVVIGGVFMSSGGTLTNGVYDVNDASTEMAVTGTSFSGNISMPDTFGRGNITGTNLGGIAGIVVNYYDVGSEAVRIIDVDTTDAAAGSAFGQGTGAFTSGSLGSSVFSITSASYGSDAAAAGMFSTNASASPPSFTGVADDNEQDNELVVNGAEISGMYSMNNNGYGSLTITSGNLGNVSALGIYMVDPKINVNDPNNTSSGLGGALVADMDEAVVGTAGVLVPQADTSPSSFAGNYAFGAQAYDFYVCCTAGHDGWEFDFIGQGSVSAQGTGQGEGFALNGTGDISDPFEAIPGSNGNGPGANFTGIASPDPMNPGRYTMYAPDLFVIQLPDGTSTSYYVAIYQASGGLLFWVDEDAFLAFRDESVFGGSLQEQPAAPAAVSPLPAVRVRAQSKLKP